MPSPKGQNYRLAGEALNQATFRCTAYASTTLLGRLLHQQRLWLHLAQTPETQNATAKQQNYIKHTHTQKIQLYYEFEIKITLDDLKTFDKRTISSLQNYKKIFTREI